MIIGNRLGDSICYIIYIIESFISVRVFVPEIQKNFEKITNDSALGLLPVTAKVCTMISS